MKRAAIVAVVVLAGSRPALAETIVVVAGTYGGNCGQPRGNKTAHLAQACDGRAQCSYTINYQVIGDPAVGCGKGYTAEWRCSGSSAIRSTAATPEAGSNKVITLSCPAGGGIVGKPPVVVLTPPAKPISVVAGTYGGNCRQPRGNKTAHLAQACNGRTHCAYVIDYQVIGDPAVGCGKSYVAEWRCGDSPIHRAVVAPEAGSRQTVVLACSAPTKPVVLTAPSRGIVVVAGTYGGNCGQPRGNKTLHLGQACNGRTSCLYKINYQVIGDPAVGCGKSYVAEWRCGGSSSVRRAEAPPEAGHGKVIRLACP